MTENENENLKSEVPIFTLEEYKNMIKEGKRLPHNYKIAENDKEEFVRSITQ